MTLVLRVTACVLVLWQILPTPTDAFPSPPLEPTSAESIPPEADPTTPISEESIKSRAAAPTAAPNVFNAIREGLQAMGANLTGPMGGGDPVKFFENLLNGGRNEQGQPQLILKGSSALIIPMQDGMKNFMNLMNTIFNN